jgi:hypothetical protein
VLSEASEATLWLISGIFFLPQRQEDTKKHEEYLVLDPFEAIKELQS